MKKKVFSLILFLMLIFSLVIPASASGNFVSDEAGLLSESDISTLNDASASIYDEHGIAVFVATAESLGGRDVVDTADLLLESTGVKEGILLYLSMEERDYAISTMGEETIWYFNDPNLHAMENEFLPYLSDGDYARGFEKFVTLCDDVITYEKENANNNAPYEGDDGYYVSSGPKIFSPIRLIVSFLIGLLGAGIPLSAHKKAIQNVAKKTEASAYVRQGGLPLSESQDIFLYRHVNRIPRNVDTGNRGGGSRPGGTTHFSSSGVSHGGSHGKF